MEPASRLKESSLPLEGERVRVRGCILTTPHPALSPWQRERVIEGIEHIVIEN